MDNSLEIGYTRLCNLTSKWIGIHKEMKELSVISICGGFMEDLCVTLNTKGLIANRAPVNTFIPRYHLTAQKEGYKKIIN